MTRDEIEKELREFLELPANTDSPLYPSHGNYVQGFNDCIAFAEHILRVAEANKKPKKPSIKEFIREKFGDKIIQWQFVRQTFPCGPHVAEFFVEQGFGYEDVKMIKEIFRDFLPIGSTFEFSVRVNRRM